MSNDQPKLQRFKLNNSSSFNDLKSLSIYNNGNSYSSMSDVKNPKPLSNMPMGHSLTTQGNNNNKRKKYNKHNVLRINTTTNNFKEKNSMNVRHYNKVSEVTLLDKPFSELIFEDYKDMIEINESEQKSPTSETKKFTYLYGTAKEHGFGTNNDTKDNLLTDQSPEIENEDIQRGPPFGTNILNESSKSLTISQSNSVKNLRMDDINKTDTLVNINRLNSYSSNNLIIKISQSNNLLNPIKELIIKQLNSEIEMSFKELDFYNNKDLDEESKVNDNFYKVENIINEKLINKKVLMFLHELDNSEREYLKQVIKIKELNRWKLQTNNKIKQVENTIRHLYYKQIHENLNDYHRMKEVMEKKFRDNLLKNETMTKNYSEIKDKYKHLINVKLPNLERWDDSITKMRDYEKKTKVTIINVYDISLLSILIILYVYYFYP